MLHHGSLSRALVLVGVLACTSPLHAQVPTCTDRAHCDAVRALEEALKPVRKMSAGETPKPGPAPAQPSSPDARRAARAACSDRERDAAQAWPTIAPIARGASEAALEISRCKTCPAADVSQVLSAW